MNDLTLESIFNELQKLKQEVYEIKSNMIDDDDYLSEEDIKDIKIAKEQHARGEYIPWEEVRKRLGLEDES